MKKRILALASALLVTGTLAWAQHGEGEPPAHPTEHGGAAAKGAHGEEHGAHDEHGAHGEGHHGPAPMNLFDISDKSRPALISLFINFGILAALYYTLGKKPVTDGLKQRRANIGKAIEEAQSMLAEAKERAKKYQADLKEADTHAETAKNALIVAGRGEADRLLSEAEEKAERMKRDAERLVEQERKQLQQDLLVETVNLAVTQAQKILESSASPEDHNRLANELLAELAKKPAAPRVAARPVAGGAS